MCERWVGDWTNCNILTPSSFVLSSTSFLFCWAAQSGSWGPIALCWVLVLSTASYLQLTDSKLPNLSFAPGYIIVWCPPASCRRHICTQFNPSTVKVIPWYLWPDAAVSRLMAGSKVSMLHMQSSEKILSHSIRVIEIDTHRYTQVPLVWWLFSYEMHTETKVQIFDKAVCISHSSNTLGKAMNPTILFLAMSK